MKRCKIYPMFAAFCFVILILAPSDTISQCNIWPQFLSIPEPYSDEPLQDTNTLSVRNDFSFYQTLREENSIAWHVDKNGYTFDQNSDLSLVKYTRKTGDNSFALPGVLYKKGFPWSSSSLGIEWVPKLNYKVRAEERTFQSTIDIGPVFKSEIYTIPVKVRSGVSADVWKENITSDILRSIVRNYSSDAGYYIGCDIGNETKKIHGIPLYVTLKATGRSVRDAGLGLLMGNILFAHDLGTGGSLLFSVSDSLSNGKESFLSQGTTFLTTPWRIVHGFALGSGIKAAERFGFVPAGYYRYNVHAVNYPSDTTQINDVKSAGHIVNIQLSSIDRYFFNYSGGFECAWSSQDWVYKSDELPIAKGLNNVDNLKMIANNNDNKMLNARMDHDITIPLPAHLALEYSFHISRDSRTYENYYIDGALKQWNQMESDGVEKLHHVGVVRTDSGAILWGLGYDYGKSVLHYLKKERSGSSRIRDTYRIGAFVGFKNKRLAIKEEFSVQAERSDYIFKNIHKVVDTLYGSSFDPPPLQRDLNSMLTGSLMFNDHYTLVCTWNERYSDDGFWYGKEYLPDTVDGDFYAIQNKTNDYSIDVHLEISLEWLEAQIGGSFRDIYSRRYSIFDKAYVSYNIGEGYLYEPYVQLLYQGERFAVKGKVKRNFNTIDPERWNIDKNWDIALSFRIEL